MIRINLLPIRAEKRKENLRKLLLMTLAGVALIALVVAGLHLSILSRIDERQAKIAAQEREITALDAKIKEVEGYNKKLKDLTEKVNLISTLEQRQRGPARVFMELARICPDKLWIEKMEDKGGSLVMEGFAIDQQTIAAFMTSLENSQYFEKVRLKETKKNEKGGMVLQSFSLQTQVVLPGAATPAPVEKAAPARAGKAG